MAKETKSKKTKVESEPEIVETTNETTEKNTETFSRIFYTILLAVIGWMALWVFAFVVIIQFGFFTNNRPGQ